jgi:NADH/NAD ratio-sensing transcriptional regulator Rex
MFMTYRVSISESTMDRMRKYVRATKETYTLPGEPGNPKFGYTVDDIVCELLEKEGF